MITITESFTITLGTAPYSYTWDINNGCASVDTPTGVTELDGKISDVVFTFEDEACFTGLVVNLIATDATGCTTPIPVTITNPCTSYVVNDLTQVTELSFIASANEPSTYDWTFDTDVFNSIITNNYISLSLKDQPIPGNVYTVDAVVTNQNNCSQQVSAIIDLVQPLAKTVTINSACVDSTSATVFFTLPVTHTKTIDWSTLVVNAPSDIIVTNNGDGRIKFTDPVITISDGLTRTFTYSVKDILGVESNLSSIAWILSPCLDTAEPGFEIIATPETTRTESSGIGTIEIPFTTSSEADVKENTFVPTISQSVSIDGKTLTTPNGIGTMGVDKISFNQTVAVPACDCELIQFTVTNAEGKVSPIASAIIGYNQLPDPVLVDIDICSTCQGATPFFDVLQGITGAEPDRSTIEIVTPPTNGTFTLLSTGFGSYTQDITSAIPTTDTVQIRVTSVNGQVSNIVDLDFVRRCSGFFTDSTVDITCSSKILDLMDLLSLTESYITGGTWTEINSADPNSYTSQGGVINFPTGIGSLDFTAITPGSYIFQKESISQSFAPQQANCPASSIEQVTITYGPDPVFTITADTDLGSNNYRVDYTLEGVAAPSNINVTVNAAAPTFVSFPSISGSFGSFIITLAAGANTVNVIADTICGGTVNDSVIINVP